MKNLLLILSVFVLFSCNSNNSKKETATVKESEEQTGEQQDVKTTEKNNSDADFDKMTKVEIETTKGNITIALYDDTPLHRDNFIKLAESGFYNGLLFHRIINSFMIQGGDPDSKNAAPGQMLGMGGPGYTVPAEIIPEHFHKKGALAAARTGDQINPKRESSGSQFYIVHGQVYDDITLNNMASQMGIKFSDKQRNIYTTVGGTPFLDTQYTVYGEVIDGLDIVDIIAGVPTGANDRPLEDLKIVKTTVIKPVE